MNPQAPIIQRRHSFLSTLVFGLSSIIMTLLVCLAVVLLYGMNIADRKSDNLTELVEHGIRSLPEIQKSLPPVLADVFKDRRRPDYHEQLEIAARMVRAPHGDGYYPVVELENKGDEVVTLLSLRIVALDDKENPVGEWHAWAATPFTTEDREWRGPLYPHSRRHFAAWQSREHRRRDQKLWMPADLDVRVEITDIRVWDGEARVRDI